jgi:hypothetical protein
VSYSHGATDNIERIAEGTRGYYDALGVHLNFENDGERVNAGVRGAIQYRVYSREEIDDEKLGDLHAGARFSIVPQRFIWNLEGSYGQGATDSFVVEGPGNRESIQVLQTGPDLTLPFGGRMGLELKGQYSDRSYSLSRQLDNEALREEINLFRQSSRTSRFGVSLVRSDIEYKSQLPGYVLESVAFGYNKDLASGNVLAQVGRNRVVFDNFDSDGPLYRFEWRRNVTAKSRIGIIANRQLTDAGELFGLVTGQIGADRPLGILLTSNPLQQTSGGFEYGYSGDRTLIAFRIAKTREEYEVDTSIDNDSVNSTIDVRRALNTTWALGASFSALDRDYTALDRKTQDRYSNLYLTRKFGSRFVLDISAGRNERKGPDEPKENLYGVRFVYTPRAAR